MELELHSELIYKNNLDVNKFARMLNDPSQCYKFYWLEAIVNLITTTNEDLTFDQIINEMIWEAWHSVTCYHLHLGPTIRGKSENFLEHAIGIIEKDPLLKQPTSKKDVMEAIARNESELRSDKNSLIIYVPYRLLSSFLDEVSGSDPIWDSQRRLIVYFEMLNQKTPLLYTIIDGKGLQKKVHVNEYWKQLIFDNYSIITSWIQLKKIRFLQDRNPGVPGIIYKLSQENATARKLGNARELWKSAALVGSLSVYDIYSGRKLDIFCNPIFFYLEIMYLLHKICKCIYCKVSKVSSVSLSFIFSIFEGSINPSVRFQCCKHFLKNFFQFFFL